MKNNFSRVIAMMFFLMAMNPLFAQQTVRWDSYGVGFSLPDDFEVTTNTNDEFSSENENIYLLITPWHDEVIGEEELADGVEAAAEEFDFDTITDVSEANVSDFIGFAVQGKKDGLNTMIVLLLDEQSSTNLVVIMAYENGYLREVQKIFDSIYAYD